MLASCWKGPVSRSKEVSSSGRKQFRARKWNLRAGSEQFRSRSWDFRAEWVGCEREENIFEREAVRLASEDGSFHELFFERAPAVFAIGAGESTISLAPVATLRGSSA
jgi:hypothetical protein